MLNIIYSVVWEGFTVRMFHKKCYKVALVFSTLQGIKNSGAHIHFSETASNAHICRFCFWYASQQIKLLIAFDVELILWTASARKGANSQADVTFYTLGFELHWAVSSRSLCWPSAGMVAEGRKEGGPFGLCRKSEVKGSWALQRSHCQPLQAVWQHLQQTGWSQVFEKRGFGDGWREPSQAELRVKWECGNNVCCGTCGLHGRVTDGTGAAWQSMDKASW